MTDGRKPTFKGLVCRGCYALGTACGHCERCAVDPLNPANAKPAPIPAQPSPEQEREANELIDGLVASAVACRCIGGTHEDMCKVPRRRDDLRSRLLSVVSPPADTGKET